MIVDNLRKYLEFIGVTVSQAEKDIGVSNGTLSKPFKNNKTIKTDTLEKFLSHFNNLNFYWVVTGEGNIEKTNESTSENIKSLGQLNSQKEIITIKDEIRKLKGLYKTSRDSISNLSSLVLHIGDEVDTLKEDKQKKQGRS